MCNGQNISQWGIDQNTELMFRLCNLLCLQAFVSGVSFYETKYLSEFCVIHQFCISLEVHTCWWVNLRQEQHSRSVNGCGARVVCTLFTVSMKFAVIYPVLF
jgi:hypothetical protein